MTSDWRPLVTDPARRIALAGIIGDIARAVAATPPGHDHVDRAVLHAYLAEDRTCEDGALVAEALERAVANLAGCGVGLYGGIAGVGWALGHLAAGDHAAETCAAIDRVLEARLAGDWQEHYDLIGGLVGIGVYALDRGPPGRPLAMRVMDELERLARPHDGGLAWHTAPELLPQWQRRHAPTGVYDLGMAHGIPGPIALFARCLVEDVDVARATRLLDGGVAYLLAVAVPTQGARYPPSHPGVASERLAWCYGDLGVSTALLAAAHAREHRGWRADAVQLARRCAATTFDAACVRDTSLCHGASGVAHLFHRLHFATGEQSFADAALRWLDRTLALRDPAHAIAGFPRRRHDGERITWVPDTTLLNGASGVALALHAMISEVEPNWDRLLLVDLAP
jgi:lantibiotic biosynthesis protein